MTTTLQPGTRKGARPRSGRGNWVGLALASPPILVVAVFIGFPVVLSLLFTFGYGSGLNDVVAAQGQDQFLDFPTIQPYLHVLADKAVRQAIVATSVITVISVTVVLILAWAIALYVRLAAGRLGQIVAAVAVTPMFIPVVIASYAIAAFYSPDGFLHNLGQQLGFELPKISYTIAAVVIAQIWVNLPFGVLLITSGLQAVPDALIDASRDVGASMTRTVVKVLMPMTVVPSVIVGTFTAIGVMGSFTVPYITGGASVKVLGPMVTDSVVQYGRPQQAEVMSALIFIAASVIGFVYVWANVRSEKSARGAQK